MRSTMAGFAPGTGSGTLVFTCATTAREPPVAASAAAKAPTRRFNALTSAMFSFLCCGRSLSVRLFGRDLHDGHRMGLQLNGEIAAVLARSLDRLDAIG